MTDAITTKDNHNDNEYRETTFAALKRESSQTEFHPSFFSQQDINSFLREFENQGEENRCRIYLSNAKKMSHEPAMSEADIKTVEKRPNLHLEEDQYRVSSSDVKQ